MATFAFMDTGAGYFQGSQTADDLREALRAYAKDVGLNEEIDVAIYVAEVSAVQLSLLENHYDFRGLTDEQETVANSISWRLVPDADVRDLLGYAPRKID